MTISPKEILCRDDHDPMSTAQFVLKRTVIGVFETIAPAPRNGEAVGADSPAYAEMVITPVFAARLMRLQEACRVLGVRSMCFAADAMVRWAAIANHQLTPGGLTDVTVSPANWQASTVLKFREGREYRTPDVDIEWMIARMNDVLDAGQIHCYFGCSGDDAFEKRVRPMVEPGHHALQTTANHFSVTEVVTPGMAP